jgi:hypothetical protein
MTGHSIVSWFPDFTQIGRPLSQLFSNRATGPRHTLHACWRHQQALPTFVRQSSVAMRCVELLGPLAWDDFPERNLQPHWHQAPVPYAPFAAACLVKLEYHIPHMSGLRQFLVDHPPLVWVLGFPLSPSRHYPWGFDVEASLPTHRHLTFLLRQMPNAALQYLLDSSVQLLQAELRQRGLKMGDCVSLDTKHVIAWVKENNPKAYVQDRFTKGQQPAGDPDCRLGCKRRHNQRGPAPNTPPTPTCYPSPANTLSVGEFYWGYGSGVVAAKVPDWGEFVLAELTQPFDQGDATYFFPLMAATEKRLGFRPPYAALDAAFDAFYVYEHFHSAGGFAAVPFVERGGYKDRKFTADGLPLCQAGLPMPLKFTFMDKQSTLIEHERGRYVCPLRYPQPNGETCPAQHKNWAKGGCIVTMPTSIGARLRYTLDRETSEYQEVYKQRTASERVNSQAVELGIERPKIRNGSAIANLNTLVYVLINLRALQRIRQRPVNNAGQASPGLDTRN